MKKDKKVWKSKPVVEPLVFPVLEHGFIILEPLLDINQSTIHAMHLSLMDFVIFKIIFLVTLKKFSSFEIIVICSVTIHQKIKDIKQVHF